MVCDTDGFFTRGQARDPGYDDSSVAYLVRAGIWHRFRRGYYCLSDIWASLDDLARHRIRCRAVLHSLGGAVALSHTSGLVVHGVDVWPADLNRVDVTRLDGGASRIEGDVVHHHGHWSESDLTQVERLTVLRPERCAIEHGLRTTSESALVSFNSMLHLELCDQDALMAQFAAMGSWPHVQHLHIPVRIATPLPESVGESRGLWLFWASGLPAPECQVKVFDDQGNLIGICDWAWRDRGLYGEFDGALKYGRLLKPGQDVGAVVFAEKRREDLIREVTHGTMVRLVWSDYDRPRVTAARVGSLLRLAG